MAPAEPRPPRRVYLAGLASLASLTALDRTNGHLLSWTCQFVLVRTEPLREDCAEVGPVRERQSTGLTAGVKDLEAALGHTFTLLRQ
ncbi:hypothetical protein AGIG_G18171 [Arapaima gigas]